MERMLLFKLKRPDIKISMEIYFNQEGQLIFDGYDIGKTNGFVGDFDARHLVGCQHVTSCESRLFEFYDIFNDI